MLKSPEDFGTRLTDSSAYRRAVQLATLDDAMRQLQSRVMMTNARGIAPQLPDQNDHA